MQIKTTMSYHLIPVRIAVIKKNTNNECWQGCGVKEIPVQCWWESQLVQQLENNREGLQKTKNSTTI